MSRAGLSMHRTVRGLSLIELITVIVLLGILAVGFMSMYANVSRRNATGAQIAPMTWFGEGVMATELLQTDPLLGSAPFAFGPTTTGPYTVNATVSQTKTKVATGTYYAYLITVTVTCVTGSCTPVRFTAHAYTIH
jgi:prepilin-type N-terminal cleavage/methylation domain-containing protein